MADGRRAARPGGARRPARRRRAGGRFRLGADAAGSAVQRAVRHPLALRHGLAQALAEQRGARPGDRRRAGLLRHRRAERDDQPGAARGDLRGDGERRGGLRPAVAAGRAVLRDAVRTCARAAEPRRDRRLARRGCGARLGRRRGGDREPAAGRGERRDGLQPGPRHRCAGGQGRAACSAVARRWRAAGRPARPVRDPSAGEPRRHPGHPDRRARGLHPRALGPGLAGDPAGRSQHRRLGAGAGGPAGRVSRHAARARRARLPRSGPVARRHRQLAAPADRLHPAALGPARGRGPAHRAVRGPVGPRACPTTRPCWPS